MGSGYSKMKKQAKMMQEQAASMKEKMEKLLVTGSAPNNLVTLTLNGEKELLSIKISPECVQPQDTEGLEDLIMAAFKDASEKVNEQSPQSPF